MFIDPKSDYAFKRFFGTVSNKELLPDNTGVGRSTLLAPERTFAREARIETLATEILTLLNIR